MPGKPVEKLHSFGKENYFLFKSNTTQTFNEFYKETHQKVADGVTDVVLFFDECQRDLTSQQVATLDVSAK